MYLFICLTCLFAARWWTVHGTSTKDLKKMAIRILSLTCSSSACERNWSAFERVHSKKRTRLGQKKLNDLVYVMFNKRLDSKYSERERDPLLAKYIEDEPPNEWMLDEELLQDDESSEDEAEIDINSNGKQKSVASRTRGKRARTNQDVEDEEEVAEEEEMEEEDENQEAEEDNDEDQEVDIDLTVEDEEDGE
ncbi:nucleolin-like [Triticum aestivum]|uniref:nucleolin-like n=1 Tax=Triticum aestivum TaxID=4565 RepID=UPI001D009FEB|nr:nucleolin-like [Triticum aestivum]